MECEESIILLGEFHAGTLDEPQTVLVRQHLIDCRPCGGVYSDIEVLVLAARALNDHGDGISYPDEEALWQRIRVTQNTLH